VLRALALLRLAQGMAAPQVACLLELTPQAIRKIAHRYIEGGLDRALYEKQRPGAGELPDNQQKQRIVAMVCGPPPEGQARWTVRLVTDQAVIQKLVPRVGRETIRILLQSHDLKPWRKKCGAWPSSMMNTPSKWRTFWKSTNVLIIRRNLLFALTKSRSPCTPMFVPDHLQSRGGKPDTTTNTNDAAPPTSSAQ
jgi:putative transposase